MTKRNWIEMDIKILEEIKQMHGLDINALLEKTLVEELKNSIIKEFENKAADVKANNREGIIEEIINDIPFTPLNIEETEEFKRLSEENKEKYLKNGRIL